MLRRKGKITEEVVDLILSWRHSGFNVHCGPRIQPGDQDALENIARYVVRASFSQKRMTYVPDQAKVIYRSKDGKSDKAFDALEWLAAMCSHVPNKGEQMVRYYGYSSNVCRGQRKKADTDGLVPCILQTEESSKGYRKNWARLIQKIYEVDPLTCPKCHGEMRIISFIEAEEVIKKEGKELRFFLLFLTYNSLWGYVQLIPKRVLYVQVGHRCR
jgi:Putative transposase